MTTFFKTLKKQSFNRPLSRKFLRGDRALVGLLGWMKVGASRPLLSTPPYALALSFRSADWRREIYFLIMILIVSTKKLQNQKFNRSFQTRKIIEHSLSFI